MDHIEQKNFWEKCLLGIKKNYTIQQFKTWINPISVKDVQVAIFSLELKGLVKQGPVQTFLT